MIYHVRHTTSYTYTETVSICHNELRLRPRDVAQQTCLEHELVVQPAPAGCHQARDFFGNVVTFLTVQEPHRHFLVTANSTVQVIPVAVPEAISTPTWDTVPALLRADRSSAGLEAYQYVFDSPYSTVWPAIRRFATRSFPAGRPLLEAVLDLTRRIYTHFTYDQRATTVSTPLRAVFRTRRGVCQDFAHLEIACLRALGLAARYVSGYLMTRPPPGTPRMMGADASHAWLSVYCPGHGWVDVDPTNNVLPSDGHITVAYGRDFGDVSPIKGVFLGGGEHSMAVTVDVLPAEPEPVSSPPSHVTGVPQTQ
jgi:transglutaminase-like putative cysteine protease